MQVNFVGRPCVRQRVLVPVRRHCLHNNPTQARLQRFSGTQSRYNHANEKFCLCIIEKQVQDFYTLAFCLWVDYTSK